MILWSQQMVQRKYNFQCKIDPIAIGIRAINIHHLTDLTDVRPSHCVRELEVKYRLRNLMVRKFVLKKPL